MNRNDDLYFSTDFKTISSLEGIRRRPGMYFPFMNDVKMCNTFIFETLCHAIDEFVSNNCTHLQIKISEKEATIQYDAGICLELDEDGISHAETILTQLFACRHTKQHSEIGHKYCGIGLTVVVATAKEFSMTTVSNGQKGQVTYQEGKAVCEFEISPCDEPEYTLLRFSPDPQIFGDKTFQLESIRETVQELMTDFPGFRITLSDHSK
jgi:DNA gyrase subunit B